MKTYIELELDGLTMRGYERFRDKSTCLVLFHGFTGHKMETNRMFINIDRILEHTHISTLRFDWFGHGESDLDFSQLRIQRLIQQGKTILNYAKDKYKNVYLLGFSMGGLIAMNLLNLSPDRLILISPATQMYESLLNRYHQGIKNNDGYVNISGYNLSLDFVESFSNIDFKPHLESYQNSVLLIQGKEDKAVSVDSSRELKKHISDCHYVEINEADHGYSNFKAMDRLLQLVHQFLIK